jgi:uncharacterized alkaline shock family protein YloU
MELKTQNANGDIVIREDVLAKIAGMTATRCYGVVGMTSRKSGLAKLVSGDAITKGVGIEVENERVSIDLHIMVEYGVNINAICQSIINSVKFSIEHMSGFKVGKITVHVESARVD